MTRLSRSLVVTGALAMALGLAACGGDDDDAADDAPAGDTSEASTDDESADATGGASAPDETEADGDSGGATGSGTVRVRLGAETDTLDPHQNYGFIAATINQAAYDSIVKWDVETQTVIPAIATEWELGDQSITFTLRDDVVCSDGTPLDAEQVAASFNRFFERSLAIPSMTSPLNSTYGVDANPNMVADDPTHVTLTWSSDFSAENVLVDTWRSYIVCGGGLEEGADFNSQSYGTGPFQLVSYEPGVGIKYDVRREYKWGPRGLDASALPDHFEFVIVTNATTAANMLTTDALEVAYVSGPDADRLINDPSMNVKQVSSNTTRALVMNAHEGHPTADLALRQAIAMVVDREEYNIAENGGNQGLPSASLLVPSHPCALENPEQYTPQGGADEARALLEEAGYVYDGDTLTKDGSPVVLKFPADLAWNAAPEYVANVLAEIGIEAQIDATDFTTWLPKLLDGDYDITVGQYDNFNPIGPYLGYFVGPSIADGGGSTTYTVNDEAYQLWLQSRSQSGDEFCQSIKDLQQSVLENSDFIPLHALTVTFASKNWDFLVNGSTQIEPGSLNPLD